MVPFYIVLVILLCHAVSLVKYEYFSCFSDFVFLKANHDWQAVVAPIRCAWQGIYRGLVASTRAVKISCYIILLLPLLTAWGKQGQCHEITYPLVLSGREDKLLLSKMIPICYKFSWKIVQLEMRVIDKAIQHYQTQNKENKK